MSTDTLSRDGWSHHPAGTLHAAGADVDAQVSDVYQYARRHGEISLTALEEAGIALGRPVWQVRSAVLHLLELHLLATDGVAGERVVPVDPQSAASRLAWPVERASYQQRGIADRLRERIDTIARRHTGGTEAVGTIDGLADTMEIRGLLKLAGDVCRDEMVVLNPWGCDNEWDALLDACGPVLERGATVRIVLPHRSRAGFASRARVRTLADGGACVRTTGHVPQASVVFDRSLAVVFEPDAGGPSVARRVCDEIVVRYLLTMFDQVWQVAAAFGTGDEGYAGEVTDDLQRSIVRLMAEGFTDEAVARRLGMSVRTCRRHIAALLGRLGAVSRFQAGVLAARRLADEALPA